jgi:hypothetical protein
MEFTILEKEYYDNRNDKRWFYTLSKVDNTELYATHLYNQTDNIFLSGHYDDSLENVLQDFKKRCEIAKRHKLRIEQNKQSDYETEIEKTRQKCVEYIEHYSLKHKQKQLSKKYEIWRIIDGNKIKVGVIRSKLDRKENLFLPNTWKVYGGYIRYFSKVGKPTPKLALKNLQNARGGSYELREIKQDEKINVLGGKPKRNY